MGKEVGLTEEVFTRQNKAIGITLLKMEINEAQREILSRARFAKDGARFSELKQGEMENDLFNYHLQLLVKGGYLVKKGSRYALSQKGKSVVTNIDEEDKKITLNYKVSVYICLVEKGKVLLYKRLKHPQYGYVGLPGGKIKYGEKILDTAARELDEETGAEAKLKVIGNMRQIRKDAEGKVIEDGIFYVCYGDRHTGKIKEVSQEGEFFWVDLDKVEEIERQFKPSLGLVISEVRNRLSGKVEWEEKFIYELEPELEEY